MLPHKTLFKAGVEFGIILQPKYNKEGWMWPDPQALQSFCVQHLCHWDQCEEHRSILALSTLPSTILLCPHYPPCVGVHTWAAWVTVTFMGLSRPTTSIPRGHPPHVLPVPSLEVSNCATPPRPNTLIYPLSISQIDWTAGPQNELYIQVNPQEWAALGYYL